MPRRATSNLSGLLVLAAAASIACRSPSRPDSPPAEAEAPHLIHLEPQKGRADLVGDGVAVKMRAIPADLPSTLSWRVLVPARSRLETHLSFSPAMLGELEGLACQARVEVKGEDGVVLARLERQVQPLSSWEPYVADLEASPGRAVEVRLSAECPGRSRSLSGAVRWSVPMISPPRSLRDLNLLLVTIDTLRPDHLQAYGYPRATSPNIDRLAGRGVLFKNAETVQSATWPALTSLHTSLYPGAHGVLWNGQKLGEGFLTLAQVLHTRHFSTSAFLTNMKRGRHPGFSLVVLARGGDQARADEEAVDAAIRQLRVEKDRRFFLWLHLLSPHAGYNPPAPFDTAFTRRGASRLSPEIEALRRIRAKKAPLREEDVAHIVGLYDGEIAWTDELLGRLLAALRELGLQRNTLVAFTADHGEDLYEHNRYFFHSPSIYGSSIRIPLILALPGVLPAGETIGHLASIVDVAPTVLGLLGLPPVSQFQGVNLLPDRSLPAKPVRTMAMSETHGKIFAARTEDWRFIYNPEKLHPAAPGGPYPIGELELYDQRETLLERRNLAGSRPDLVRALTSQILAWNARYRRQDLPAEAIDPETQEELKALGYVAQ